MWGFFVRVTGLQLEFSSLFLLVEDICCRCWRWCCWRIIGKMGRSHVEDGLLFRLYTCLQTNMTLKLTKHCFPLTFFRSRILKHLQAANLITYRLLCFGIKLRDFFSSNYFSQYCFWVLALFSTTLNNFLKWCDNQWDGKPPISWDFFNPP